jgi:hypothetical protein
MFTSSRTAINRANAQHSTGPKTAEGKQRSSLNALRHGLTGQLVVMPNEDAEAYQALLTAFTAEYQPVGPTESTLVQALADTSWRLSRVAALETNLLALGITTATAVTDAPQPVQDALAIAATLERKPKALSNLSMHSQRLSRQFERTIAQLKELQKTRRAEEQSAVSDLLDVLEMYKDKGETYDPTADGFVFSETEIHAALRARNRERIIEKAHEHAFDAAA